MTHTNTHPHTLTHFPSSPHSREGEKADTRQLKSSAAIDTPLFPQSTAPQSPCYTGGLGHTHQEHTQHTKDSQRRDPWSATQPSWRPIMAIAACLPACLTVLYSFGHATQSRASPCKMQTAGVAQAPPRPQQRVLWPRRRDRKHQTARVHTCADCVSDSGLGPSNHRNSKKGCSPRYIPDFLDSRHSCTAALLAVRETRRHAGSSTLAAGATTLQQQHRQTPEK